MKYSVVIATYNRNRLLLKNLESLRNQTIPKDDYEIIIVNDGSSDSTESDIKFFTGENPDLDMRYFRQKNSGPSKARNRGIREARGEIIFLTDDDCIPPENWIETLAQKYSLHPEVAGVGGWYYYPQESLKNWFVRYSIPMFLFYYQKFMSDGEINNNLFRTNPAGNTSNMSYRKQILDLVNGFDEKLNFVGMVDWELKKRIMDLGYPLLYISEPVLHLKPLGMKEIIRKYFNRGRGQYHMVQKNPELFFAYKPRLFLREKVKNVKGFDKQIFYLMGFVEYIFRYLGWIYQWFTY